VGGGGRGLCPHPPTPNPQSPIPNPQSLILKNYITKFKYIIY